MFAMQSVMYLALAAGAKAHGLSAEQAQDAYEAFNKSAAMPTSVEDAWYFLDYMFADAQH